MNRFHTSHIARAASPLMALALLAGCATGPVAPTAELGAANAAITDAQRAGATEHATTALQLAQDKLTRARMAADREDYEAARRLAVEAETDARLALATAQSMQAQRAADEVRQSIATLRQELGTPTR